MDARQSNLDNATINTCGSNMHPALAISLKALEAGVLTGRTHAATLSGRALQCQGRKSLVKRGQMVGEPA
jgi:hypothetical protein